MLNEKYISRMKRILGEEDFLKYISCFDEKSTRSFHINTNKIKPEKFLDIFPFNITPVPYLENSYYFDESGIGNHPFHHAGMFYIQEPAAMFPVGAAKINQDWKILDMCASPGGKSSQVMQRISEAGQLVSNEINPSRCKTLCSNFERLGYTNATVTCSPTEKLAEEFDHYFDLVIVDAPCSGEGMFRKEPSAVSEWSEENVHSCAKRQAFILDNAAKCVTCGGYILYSTCTFSPEENEHTVDAFLQRHPNFKPVPFSPNISDFTAPGILTDYNADFRNECMRRFYPFISKGEGQFAALLQNNDDTYRSNAVSNPFRRPTKNEMIIIKEFVDETLEELDFDNVFINNDRVILCDKDKFYPKKSYMCGVTVGQLQKSYIKPHHQLFSSLGKKFLRKIDFSAEDELLSFYLRGGSFHFAAEKGWGVVTVNGVPLGGCKIVDGYLKNHYPKGLHILK